MSDRRERLRWLTVPAFFGGVTAAVFVLDGASWTEVAIGFAAVALLALVAKAVRGWLWPMP